MSKEKDEKRARENAELFAKVKEHVETVATKYAAAENMNDPAKKILALLELQDEMYRTKWRIRDLQENLIRKRAAGNAKTYVKRTILTALSLPVITLIITSEADWTSVSAQKKEEKKLRQAVNVEELEQKMAALQKDVRTSLDETTAHCNLHTLSDSPDFAKAYKEHEPLRDRFEAVAAARAALGDKPAPQPEQPQPEQSKPEQSKPQTEEIAAPKKRLGTYDHFRKL